MPHHGPSRHPVLRTLAVLRAARDFGVHPAELDPVVLRHPFAAGAVDHLSDAAAAAVLRDGWLPDAA